MGALQRTLRNVQYLESTVKHATAPHWRAWAREVRANKLTFPYAYGKLEEGVAWKEVQKKAGVTEQKTHPQ